MAGLPHRENFESPTASRSSKYSQTSNSVPSTPYQKPRDFRFHSRSPSPHRGISNHSPKSVLSEAVGQTVSNRAAPVVCKYETGDEIRKRRIPYVDGGNEELGPPKKEPKKNLEPDEQDRLSGDMRELYDRLLPSEESEERRTKLVSKLNQILNDEWPDYDIRVNVFGSSGNLLSSTDSDVDICITTPLKKFDSMHSLAALLSKHGMEKVVCRAAAKVPIVKCWDPELQLAADLNVNNTLALQNTRMIKTYVQIDDRVRPLAKIIKYWTKQRILNDAAFGGTISSYTWICMIINFLQRREPPILPSLQKIQDCRRVSDSEEPTPFADDIDALRGWGHANKESLGELLFQFFRHYGYEFEYSSCVVSVREGRPVSRQEKGWQPSNYLDKEARNRLCVEEPFTINRNLGNSADDYAWHGIHGEIRRAFDLLADGLQLAKCCEQYEFPLEEKPIFQKPAPKPKPTLTRSASQSGRSDNQQGSNNRSRKNNRNQSAQRAGSRRASSGASFSNQRMLFPFSPTIGGTPSDYFGVKGNLHEQLFQQYQLLQLQESHLRTQVAALNTGSHAGPGQGQIYAHPRNAELTGSPRPRAFPNGLPSPRSFDNIPQSAPLLPGYLYHYPAQYPPASPMSQARSRDGTNTSPSSPSLMPAVPALRRQVHRASVPEVNPTAARSQSQPGRSLPHSMTLQQQVHPGYDVSGAIPAQFRSARASQVYLPGHPGFAMSFPQHYGAMHPGTQPVENSIPKEYVGYYVGQSPSMPPQQATVGQMQPPPLTLRDPPQRQRRITPDLIPPTMNGKHTSRSPSPLSHLRSYSTTSSQPHSLTSPSDYSQNEARSMPSVASDFEMSGPVIVDGSNRAPPKAASVPNGVTGHAPLLSNGLQQTPREEERARLHSLQLRTEFDRRAIPDRTEDGDRRSSSPHVSPTTRGKSVPRFSLSPNGTSRHTNGVVEHINESAPLSAPLLSPVAELRTPSPTRTRTFDLQQESPRANGSLAKAAKLSLAKQAEHSIENQPPSHADAKHERKGSLPLPSLNLHRSSQTIKSPLAQTSSPTLPPSSHNQNQWQQATRKGHKKSRSTAAAKLSAGPGGQPMPVNEAERKGG